MLDQHGIKSAVYRNDGFALRPVLECLCGESFESEFTWEKAGRLLDAHLEEQDDGVDEDDA